MKTGVIKPLRRARKAPVIPLGHIRQYVIQRWFQSFSLAYVDEHGNLILENTRLPEIEARILNLAGHLRGYVYEEFVNCKLRFTSADMSRERVDSMRDWLCALPGANFNGHVTLIRGPSGGMIRLHRKMYLRVPDWATRVILVARGNGSELLLELANMGIIRGERFCATSRK